VKVQISGDGLLLVTRQCAVGIFEDLKATEQLFFGRFLPEICEDTAPRPVFRY
jgi:hypothetical protein